MNLELTPSIILSSLRSNLRHSLHATSPSQSVTQQANLNSYKKILVAYSGGMDSHVVLHLLSQIPRDQFHLRAVYVNHGLQKQASEWSDHCQKVCKDLEISFTNINLNLKIPKGESLEEVARKARYQALYTELQQGEVLITGHHQSDQAETVLLQLFRGAGVQGLAAMPSVSNIKSNQESYIHLRPLLNYSRQALENYAKEFGLEYIEDPTNRDTSYDRNFLRQEIMPLLRQRWLGIDKAISRTASLQAETKTLLDEFAKKELPTVLASELNFFTLDKNQSTLATPIVIPELIKHSEAKQRLLLRYWISQHGFETPSAKKLEHVFSDMIESSSDKQPLVTWRGAELRRFQEHLYIMPPISEHDVTQVISWQIHRKLHIPSINVTLSPDLIETNAENVTVRFRQGGETIEIPKRGNISLKNLFQELQVPPWIRQRLPLIYAGEKLIKIVGLDESS